MISSVDQLGNEVMLNESPQRIVSLVPSQTELLHFLQLDEHVVGITKFCIHPEVWFKSKERVGGTKSVDIGKVRSLNPDLIIANKEENTKEDIDQLESIAPVWLSDVNSIGDALSMITEIGRICNVEEAAKKLISDIEMSMETLKIHPSRSKQNVLYIIWDEPAFVVGKHTFIDSMLSLCGWENCVEKERYPEISDRNVEPDLVLLSSEPYPFKEEHRRKYQDMFPDSKVIFVDGEMFSWYGSRMKDFGSYATQLLDELSLDGKVN